MPGVWILWSKKKKFVIIFQKENGNTFTLFIISIVKSLQKEQKSTNLLLWPPICRNKSAITPKWFNSLDTNSTHRPYSLLLCQCCCRCLINRDFSSWKSYKIKLFSSPQSILSSSSSNPGNMSSFQPYSVIFSFVTKFLLKTYLSKSYEYLYISEK